MTLVKKPVYLLIAVGVAIAAFLFTPTVAQAAPSTGHIEKSYDNKYDHGKYGQVKYDFKNNDHETYGYKKHDDGKYGHNEFDHGKYYYSKSYDKHGKSYK